MNRISVTQEGLITIKEYFEKHITHLENILRTEITNSEKALVLAKREFDRRMEGFPEIYIKREEVRAELLEIRDMVKDLAVEIASLQEAKAELKGKASQQALLLVLVVALASIVLGGIGLVMRALSY